MHKRGGPSIYIEGKYEDDLDYKPKKSGFASKPDFFKFALFF